VIERSLDQFAIETCGELRWYEVCVVALAMLGKPAKAAELAETPPVRAKAAVRGRTQGLNQ
jgi:hypothetical protein